jgi:hypothetical protein
MKYRIGTDGENVTGKPALCDPTDAEFCTTNFPHPNILSGQHTNGPPSIWIRRIGGEWIRCRERALHHAIAAFVSMGFAWFEEVEAEDIRQAADTIVAAVGQRDGAKTVDNPQSIR